MDQLNQLLPLVVLAGAFYLLIIRPQQKRQRDHRALMDSLQVGDRVVTIGGVYGTVSHLDDDRVGVEVATGVIVEFARSAIARKIEDAGADA
ncbi:MAG: preprotein translocase subunit YajC [Aeromicrobium sp.]|nr:preprotein translocase subunit YajC [Aeromicrobium sp.]